MTPKARSYHALSFGVIHGSDSSTEHMPDTEFEYVNTYGNSSSARKLPKLKAALLRDP